MTAKKSTTKRMFNITIMRPVFQTAILEIEATTAEEAAELAVERETHLKDDDWNGPFERAVHDDAGNDSPPFVFRSRRGDTAATESPDED